MANVKTQGTEVFALTADGKTLIDIGCVVSISGISSPSSQLDTTCLAETHAQTYEQGLGQPGSITLTIRFDPNSAAQMQLYKAWDEGSTLQWCVGYSDGPRDGGKGVKPGVKADGGFELANSRSWIVFSAYINDWPQGFEQNQLVTAALPLQMSGRQTIIPKTA